MKKKLVAILSLLLLSCALLMATVTTIGDQDLVLNGTVHPGSDIDNPNIDGGDDEDIVVPPISADDGLYVYATYLFPAGVTAGTSLEDTTPFTDAAESIAVDLNESEDGTPADAGVDICIWVQSQASPNAVTTISFDCDGFTKNGGSADDSTQHLDVNLAVADYSSNVSGYVTTEADDSADTLKLTATGTVLTTAKLAGACKVTWPLGLNQVLEAGAYTATLQIKVEGN